MKVTKVLSSFLLMVSCAPVEVLPFVKTQNHATLVPCSELWAKYT